MVLHTISDFQDFPILGRPAAQNLHYPSKMTPKCSKMLFFRQILAASGGKDPQILISRSGTSRIWVISFEKHNKMSSILEDCDFWNIVTAILWGIARDFENSF